MLNFAVKRWSLPCCSDNGKIPIPKDFQSADPSWKTIDVAVSNCIECIVDIEPEIPEEDDEPEDDRI
jgi:hypothetical protein